MNLLAMLRGWFRPHANANAEQVEAATQGILNAVADLRAALRERAERAAEDTHG